MPEERNMIDNQRPCPVCNSNGLVEFITRQDFSLTEGHVLPNSYSIVSCDNCGCIYADTTATQDEYDKYYSEGSKYEADYINETTDLFINRASRINIFIENKSASILDVGCGNGQLLLELQKLGYTNLTALDPSETCIKSIREHGIEGIVSSIFDAPIDKKYDFIILSGVLEHIYDISKLMNTMKELTKPNGELFVIVPDAARYKDFDIVPFDYFNIEHINHFDEISLINLGLSCGWQTVGMIKSTIQFYNETQPIIFHVYQNSEEKCYNYQNYSESKVKEYIDLTSANKKINNLIDRLRKTNEEIIIWGAGNYTSRLLSNTGLAKCNIKIFVDNDCNKHNKFINDKIIKPPEEILNIEGNPTLVIAAAVFYEEILTQIKSMNIKNKTVVLR